MNIIDNQWTSMKRNAFLKARNHYTNHANHWTPMNNNAFKGHAQLNKSGPSWNLRKSSKPTSGWIAVCHIRRPRQEVTEWVTVRAPRGRKIHTHPYVSMCIYIYTYVSTCVFTYLRDVCIACMYIYICIYVYTCIYWHIYKPGPTSSRVS